MRLWSLHPKYLDSKALVACWREGLLVQSCLLKGEYYSCSVCDGNGYAYEQTPFNGFYSNHNQCKKCKGVGKIKTAYYNHPQLNRFKKCEYRLRTIGNYLTYIWEEANKRGYKFDANKIEYFYCFQVEKINVTNKQLDYEFEHLQQKLLKRDYNKAIENENMFIGIDKLNNIDPNPLFNVIEGEIEEWERI